MKKFFTALFCSLLISCSTAPPATNYSQLPEVTITQEQFDCGPRQPNLPPDDILWSMTDQQLFNLYAGAWNWGDKCDKTNKANYEYFKKAIADRKAAIERLEKQ